MGDDFIITGSFPDPSREFATTAKTMKEVLELVESEIGEDLRDAIKNHFGDESEEDLTENWDYQDLVELRDMLEADPKSVDPYALDDSLKSWGSYAHDAELRIYPQG